jgi:hypothetical protein
MMAKPAMLERTDEAVEEADGADGQNRAAGGSEFDTWNNAIVSQVWQALWAKNSPEAQRNDQQAAAFVGLLGIAPRDELEGMLAAQLIAAHAAAMETYRRAMHAEASFEMWKENLTQANKLSRSFATLLEALNRHRGRGSEQKVTVEHVHVHAGGQAIVGAVEASAEGGARTKIQDQPHAKLTTHAPVTSLQGPHEAGELVPIAGNAERPMPNARRAQHGRAEGKPKRAEARAVHSRGHRKAAGHS